MAQSTTFFASGELFAVARILATEAQTEPVKGLAVVPLSAAAFEAYVNDVGYWAGQVGQPHTDVWYSAELFTYADEARSSTLARAELFSRAFIGTRPDRGSKSWQDLKLLFGVRDALMHRRPETWEHDPEDPTEEIKYHRVADELIRRGIAPAPVDSCPLPLTVTVAQPEVARWAFNTAVRMVHEVTHLLPQSVRFIAFTGSTSNIQVL